MKTIRITKAEAERRSRPEMAGKRVRIIDGPTPQRDMEFVEYRVRWPGWSGHTIIVRPLNPIRRLATIIKENL